MRALCVLLGIACTAPNGPDTGSGTLQGDTGPTPYEPWQSPTEEIPSGDHLADFMFDLRTVQEVNLMISEDALSSLAGNPYAYVSADIEYGDSMATNIGVRIKGRLGSLRNFSQKPALKINIDAFVDDQNFFGLEELNLNNMVQDSAQIHDLLAYTLYNLMGVAAPRVGYLWLKVNGADYGLYLHVEAYSDPFLERNFSDPDGTLYDGDYYMPTWGSYTKLDFYNEHIPYFQQDEGEDNGRSDLYALAEVIGMYAGTDQFDEQVGQHVNMELFTRFWATEMWLGQYDGYNYNQNNYRVYFDPDDDGRAMLMPWDHDWSFYGGTPITSPAGLLSYYCRVDQSCYEMFIEAVAEVCDIAENGTMEAILDRAMATINDYIAVDPRKETSYENVLANQEAARAWIQTRGDGIRATWGIPIP